MSSISVRPADVGDAPGMAAVHVESWQQTYRGLVPDAVLDDPRSAQRRERWWAEAVSEGAEGTTSVAVAERLGSIVGIASAGRPRDSDAAWPLELFVVYLLSPFHGTGTGARLLNAVIADSPAALWVAEPNPRAQAFYRKHGFVADGATKDDGILEIRMVLMAPSPAELLPLPSVATHTTPMQKRSFLSLRFGW